VAGVVAFGKELMATGSEIEKMARTTGLSAEGIQRIHYAAQQTQTSIEGLDRSLIWMQRRQVDALREPGGKPAGAFAALSISVQDLKRLGSEELLLRMAEAVKKLDEAGSHQLALNSVMAIMERTGAQTMGMLALGREELSKMMNSAPIISDHDVALLAQANRELLTMWQQLKVMMAGPVGSVSSTLSEWLNYLKGGEGGKFDWKSIFRMANPASAIDFWLHKDEYAPKTSKPMIGPEQMGGAEGIDPDKLQGEGARLDKEIAQQNDTLDRDRETRQQRRLNLLIEIGKLETMIHATRDNADMKDLETQNTLKRMQLDSLKKQEELAHIDKEDAKEKEDIADKTFRTQLESMTRQERIAALKKKADEEPGTLRAAEYQLEAARLEHEHQGGRRVDIFRDPTQGGVAAGGRAVFAQTRGDGVLPEIKEANRQLRETVRHTSETVGELRKVSQAMRNH